MFEDSHGEISSGVSSGDNWIMDIYIESAKRLTLT